jgi:hypothetical protein
MHSIYVLSLGVANVRHVIRLPRGRQALRGPFGQMLDEQMRKRTAFNTKPGDEDTRGAIHQLLSIILKLRILVLLPVSTMSYVVKNYS